MKKSILVLFSAVLLMLPMTAFAQMQGTMMDANSMAAPLQNLRGREFDRAFYSMMIPHHDVAIEMSQKILTTTNDPQITNWASNIVVEQERERTEMINAVNDMGGIDNNYAEKMGSQLNGMVAATTSDKEYVRMMIPHHQAAVRMAEMAQGRTDNVRVLNLANAIIKTQSKEIRDFQRWANANP